MDGFLAVTFLNISIMKKKNKNIGKYDTGSQHSTDTQNIFFLSFRKIFQIIGSKTEIVGHMFIEKVI